MNQTHPSIIPLCGPPLHLSRRQSSTPLEKQHDNMATSPVSFRLIFHEKKSMRRLARTGKGEEALPPDIEFCVSGCNPTADAGDARITPPQTCSPTHSPQATGNGEPHAGQRG